MMIAWINRHGRTLLFAFALLTLTGLGAALKLPVSLFPRIDFPRVVVSVDAGERAPDQMVYQVTKPLERALRGVPGVESIRSTTSRGSADISLNFGWGRDMVSSLLQTEAAVNAAAPDLPAGVRFTVRRMDPTIFPVLGFALSSPTRDPVSLRKIAELQLQPVVAATRGVAAVEVLGGRQPEIQVVLDPMRLQALGLGPDDVAKALSAGNSISAVGRLEDRHRLFLTLVDNRVTDVDGVRAIPLRTGGANGAAGVVTIGQIAEVRAAPAPAWTRVTAQGRDAVLINVRQSPEADSVALAKAIKARVSQAREALPKDIEISTFYDQSELVTAAAGSVRDAILLGAFLAGAVLFVFLRSTRLMLVTALLLPATLVTAVLILLMLKMSFNMMTLGGMAAAVGLVVDDAVVMLEHMVRRFQEPDAEGRHLGRAALLPAAGEMIRPLVGSSLSTIVIFVPLAFLDGVTGGFFRALAVTMAAALTISLVFTLFVAPLLACAWLREQDVVVAERAANTMRRPRKLYEGLASRLLARPALVAGVAAGLVFVVGGLAYSQLPTGFMPHMDEGGFVLDYKSKPGAALSETDRLVKQVEDIIRATPDVNSYSRRTGAQLGGGLTEPDEGDFFIHLKSGSRRPVDVVMAEIRRKVQANVPGLDIETAQLMEDLIGDLTAVPQPIEIKLFGPDRDALRRAASTVAPAISKIKGVVEVVDGLRVAGDAVTIKVNRAAAALEGLDPDAVAKQVQTQLEGTAATRVQNGEIGVDVRVWTPLSLRDRVEALSNFRLQASDGHETPLSRLAQVDINPGQAQITRENLQPFIDVTARLEGRDLGSGMVEVRKTVASLNLPTGVRVEYGGLYAQQQASFQALAVVFASALLLVALLLTYLFESWSVSLSVIGTVLMAAGAVFVGLFITHTELNISALMGLTMEVGVVGELAIFFFAELPEGAAHGKEHLVEAGLARLRPILMSAAIAILALSPLALGLGEGAQMQQPLAIAIISGLIAGVPLVLFVLPALHLALQAVFARK